MSAQQRLPWRRRVLYKSAASRDNSRVRAGLSGFVLHLHPPKVPAPALRFTYTWGLGGTSALLCLLLAATGILLMFRYEATVERAYISILAIESQVAFGSLIRAIHHWSANLLIVTLFLHLIRIFLTGSYKRGRGLNWTIGLILLLLVVASNFTGYLLPWDQLAYWAITVGTHLMEYVPLIGKRLSELVLAGPEVGQSALSNFYALHVAVLPLLLGATLMYHFWRIRKDGGISRPHTETQRSTTLLPTIPNLIRREIAMAALVIAILVVWSMARPAPLEQLANPELSPNPAKAAWYFLGLQELLLHMDASAAMVLIGLVLVGLFLLPRWDRDDSDIGHYFRSKTGRRAAFFGAFVAIDLVPALVIVDEKWIDWPALFPAWPMIVATGVVPLILTLALFALMYGGFRRVLRAEHNEALVGLFTFVMCGLLILTVIGIFFRGTNMALILPF